MSTENTLKITQVEQPANQFPVAPQSPPDDTVVVGSGRIRLPDGSYYEGILDVTGVSSVFAPNTAPGVYRWDWLCLDLTTAGVVTLANSTDNALLKGTEVGVDVDWFDNVPAIPPQYMPIAAIHITEDAAPDITSADIVDIRSFLPNTNNFGWRVLAPGNLNNLLDSANGGDKYLLLPGTYTITSRLILEDNTWLVGSGNSGTGLTTVNLSMSADYGIWLSDNCVIKNLYISGGSNDVGGIYSVSDDSPIIEDTTIAVNSSVSYSAIKLVYGNYAKLKNLRLYRTRKTASDSGNVLHVQHCVYSTFDNVYVYCSYSAGAANTSRSVYIGGNATDNTVGCSFRNFIISSPGASIDSMRIEYCTDCTFDNFVGSNGTFGATAVTVEGFYYIKLSKNCKFNLSLSDYSGTYDVTGCQIESCADCNLRLSIKPLSTDYGVASLSDKTARGIYALSNSGCTFDVNILGISSGGYGVKTADGMSYGAYLYSNVSCLCKVSLIGSGGGSGVYRASSISAHSVFGVYSNANSSLNLEVFISGNGASSYGIYSGANASAQSVYGLYVTSSNETCNANKVMAKSN